jgi:hypothetical protein
MVHGAEAYCAKPGHGTIEMVQIDVFDSGNVILPHPSFTKPVGAWAEKTLQYGGENHPLNVESKAPLFRQLTDDLCNTQFVPQLLHQQNGADFTGVCGGALPFIQGIEHQQFFREAQSGAKQGVKPAAFPKEIQAAQCRNDFLNDLASIAFILDDLQIGAVASFFSSYEHWRSLICVSLQNIRNKGAFSNIYFAYMLFCVALHFSLEKLKTAKFA